MPNTPRALEEAKDRDSMMQSQRAAARKIQSVSRGRRTRKEIEKKHLAACQIQKHARGRFGRMSAKERHALRKAEQERIRRENAAMKKKIKNTSTKNDTTLSEEAEMNRQKRPVSL